MPIRKFVFTENLKAEYPFINEYQHAVNVFSAICKSLFSIAHGGWSDILQHKKKNQEVLERTNLPDFLTLFSNAV
jgi:hypothetical protein